MNSGDRDGGTRRDAGDDPAITERLAEGWNRFVRRWDDVRRPLQRAAQHSRTSGLVDRWRSAVSHSRLVQWLAREPDSRIVVVDLAETRTLGPILRVLDRTVTVLPPSLRPSRLVPQVSRLAGAVSRNAVRVSSLCLLALVVGTFVGTWNGAGPLWLSALSIAAVAGLAGLLVDGSAAALEHSRVARWTGALLAPPEDPSG